MPGPGRTHVVRGADEVGLDTDDHSVPDLEGLQERPRLRLTIDRMLVTAIGQRVLIEHSLVIDEPASHHDAALLVNEKEITITDKLVEEVVALFETLLDVGKLLAVLEPGCVGGKAR